MNPRLKHCAGEMSRTPEFKSFLVLFSKKEQTFFFEKKKQKTFISLAGSGASL
jgi:hypothetical protein